MTIGAGTIEISALTPAKAQEIIGKINRDPSKFTEILHQHNDVLKAEFDFEALRKLPENLKSFGNLLAAFAAPIPDDLTPAEGDYYRRLMAKGATPSEASKLLETPEVKKFITTSEEWKKAQDAYSAKDEEVPSGLKSAILQGATFDYSQGTPKITSDCDATGGAGCVFTVAGHGMAKLTPEQVDKIVNMVDNAEAKIKQIAPELAALELKIYSGTATNDEKTRFHILSASLSNELFTYQLCSNEADKELSAKQLVAQYGSSKISNLAAQAQKEVSTLDEKVELGYSGKAGNDPDILFELGIGTFAKSLISGGIKYFFTKGGLQVEEAVVKQLFNEGKIVLKEGETLLDDVVIKRLIDEGKLTITAEGKIYSRFITTSGDLGKAGEELFAKEFPTGVKKGFKTEYGMRYVDNIGDDLIAKEVKAGINVDLTTSIRKQIEKDIWLRDNNFINGIEWVFYQGVSLRLSEYLTSRGIKVTLK